MYPETKPKEIRPSKQISQEYSSQKIEEHTLSMSEVIPANWQKACIGAVRKYVNWPPLPDSTPGMADAILGERSKAAGSPFSALCMAC